MLCAPSAVLRRECVHNCKVLLITLTELVEVAALTTFVSVRAPLQDSNRRRESMAASLPTLLDGIVKKEGARIVGRNAPAMAKLSCPHFSGALSIPSDKRLFTAASLSQASDRTTAAIKPSTGTTFPLQDVLESQQFDRSLLTSIFEVAREMEDIEKERDTSRTHMLRGFLMATLFYEPSTRTRLSFESAMKRLGGDVLTTENAREFSSAAKGETLEDTIRTVEGYSDLIVLRHFDSGAATRAAAVASIPVINAGDGPGQHPTQALLDVYTIEREIGHLDNIKVGLVGDLANGRTVRSLAYLLARYTGVKIYFVAPEVVKMKDDIKDYLTSRGVDWEESADLMEVASNCDVVYQTRIQRERFGHNLDLYNKARGKYIVDTKVMQVLQKHAVVLHPLPRLDEIILDVDADPRAAYFRQAKNGLYIRMALIKLLLLGW